MKALDVAGTQFEIVAVMPRLKSLVHKISQIDIEALERTVCLCVRMCVSVCVCVRARTMGPAAPPRKENMKLRVENALEQSIYWGLVMLSIGV